MIVAPLTLGSYRFLRDRILELGYGHEIEWAQSVQPVSDPLVFWQEFSWVVINSGMKNQIAEQIWRKVRPAVEGGGSASEVFGHKGKAAAIDHVYANREKLLRQYLAALDKVQFLRELPWIGNITCWHLAKNYGHDVAKPDRHLARIAGAEGVNELCARLAAGSGDRIATVDLVIWRAANLGLILSKESTP
jgi:hypothetical protein